MTEPRDLPLTEMCELVRKGALRPEEIIESCLRAYDVLNDRLKAFISLDKERVLEQARSLNSKGPRSRMGCWGGSPSPSKTLSMLSESSRLKGRLLFESALPADRDAPIVDRLKKSGAIIFGKTNLHEFAWGGTSSNPHFGICRNPWNPDYIPGGSSGGSGAAVAAHMVPGGPGHRHPGFHSYSQRPLRNCGAKTHLWSAPHGRDFPFGLYPGPCGANDPKRG